jgi:hypothetical protein
MTLQYFGTRTVLALFLVFSASSIGATSIDLSVENGGGSSGSTVEVPVVARAITGLGAFQLDIVFDPGVLQLTSVSPGSVMSDGLLDWNLVEPGRVRVAAAAARPVSEPNGSLVILTFSVIEGPQSTVPVNIEKARAWQLDSSLQIPVNVKAGEFTRGFELTPVLIGAAVGVVVLLAIVVILRWHRRVSNRSPTPTPAPSPRSEGGFCPQCGKPIEPGSRFCRSCGAALS